MIQITPQMRVLVAVEPADFRCGIDGLAQRCRSVLREDPFSGCVAVFRNRSGKAIKLLVYDGQGFWLAHKRLSCGKFAHWPASAQGAPAVELLAHELNLLIFGGDPSRAAAPTPWRAVQVRQRAGSGGVGAACVP